MPLNRTTTTIHEPDPALEQRALTELVEAVVASGNAGLIAGKLVIRAHQAVAEDDRPFGHRLGDLAREILNAARRKDRRRAAFLSGITVAPFPEREVGVSMDDVLRSMGSE
jgi:hypothetical protein